jgi:hypothetical protein
MKIADTETEAKKLREEESQRANEKRERNPKQQQCRGTGKLHLVTRDQERMEGKERNHKQTGVRDEFKTEPKPEGTTRPRDNASGE